MSIPASIAMRAERAIVALLGASGSPGAVYRCDTTEFTRERVPAYNVFPARFKNQFSGPNVAKNSAWIAADFRVRCYAAGSAAVPVSEAIDPLIVWAHRQIMADPTLGGLVFDTEVIAGEMEYPEQSDRVVPVLELTVSVEFGISRSDPSVSTD